MTTKHSATRRAVLRGLATAPVAALAACDAASNYGKSNGDAAASEFVDFPAARYPLRREKGLRHLVDGAGRPFLLQGDSPWSLMVQLNRDEAALYLGDRRRRGFNALLVNLLEHKYAANPPLNRDGEGPFLVPGDFSSINHRYFDHATHVLERAQEEGHLVLLAVAYIGCCGADGWYAEMVASGRKALRDYGRYLATRFAHLPNIMWVHGGDANPADPSIVAEVAFGVHEVGHPGLHTAHTAPGHQAFDVYGDPAWLDVNNVYTYDPVAPIALEAHARPDACPFFLLESEYEGENRRAPDVRIRSQAWQAVLSGAMGQVFGNNPLWHFASPAPITPFQGGWQDALGSEGNRSMTQLRRLLESVAWWRLEPDARRAMLPGWKYTGHYDAVSASSTSGDLAIVYLPRRWLVRLDVRRWAPHATRLRWYDPVDGTFRDERAISSAAKPVVNAFPPFRRNAGADIDWVLVLDSPA